MAKKKFFDVKLNVLGATIQLLAEKPENLAGKTVKFDLTRILKGKSSEAKFRVHEKDGKLVGEIYEFSLYPSYVRRLIGKGISIVEDSFEIKSEDLVFRIKPFLITRKRVNRSVKQELRKQTRQFIEKSFVDKSSEKIFQAVMSGILQKSLSKKLKKTYPLAICEFRVVKVEKKE